MQQIKILLLLFISIFIFSCQPDEVDTVTLTNFPPAVRSVVPQGNVLVNTDFDISVSLIDGSNSPLSQATVSLLDATGTEIISRSSALSGTEGAINIPAADFSASSLALGDYTINVNATDSDGNTTNKEFSLVISTQLFGANHEEMFIAGVFNDWGADVMMLVGNNTWEVREVDLAGAAFKFKNCFDWCDEDWGDADCNGRMESNMSPDGNGDTDCGSSGLVNIRFNDEALTYSIEPAQTFAANIESLFLLGTHNDFEDKDGSSTFIQTADNTWVIEEILLDPTTEFLFVEGAQFMGDNWGDDDLDGRADAFGSRIKLSDLNPNFGVGYYGFTFDDRTRNYSVELVRGIPSIGIIGSATPGGWDSDTDMAFIDNNEFYLELELVAGEAKFRANDDWAENWGEVDFPSGVGTMGGPNIPIPEDALYGITFNFVTGAYSFENLSAPAIGIIGSATPNGWDADTDMTENEDGTYTLLIGLSDGEVKFRANDDWALNWGGADFPSGASIEGGDNIPVTAGLYWVTFDRVSDSYSFDAASVGIIGSATPTGWDADTDLNFDASNPNVLSLNITLTDGEAKFRLNDDWSVNWGAEAFPTAISELNGPNIPVTAGDYTVTFNVLTSEYSFQ